MSKSHDVANLGLAAQGKKRIDWADERMPVLSRIRADFAKRKPLKGTRVAACLHVTTETANLARTLKAGGASVVLVASNPLSTQDDTAASLVKNEKIPVYAIRGEDNKTYYQHLRYALNTKPNVTYDDGADLVSMLHNEYAHQAEHVLASMEETTTGVIRLRAMQKAGALKMPVVAVNDAKTKHLFDNRYGTGQSTIDGILRATNVLLAGQKVVICGYGWCGKGLAQRARGMGAQAIIIEVNPIRALEAAMDGFQVMPLNQAAPIGDVFITVTGDAHVIRTEHMRRMKDGAIVANSGHFDIEIDLAGLKKMAKSVSRNVRPETDCFTLKNGRRIYVLGEGRLINLSAAEGHPAAVMDMSFATQALMAEWVIRNTRRKRLDIDIYDVPEDIEDKVATLKLASMGLKIDRLTAEQKKYLASWDIGT